MSSNEGWNIWFAGAFAGLSINLFIFPLDTLKTRLQSPSYCRIYKSPTAIANRTLYRGLYQGIGTIALTAIPSSGVFFTSYEGLKAALGSRWIPQPAVHAISSGIAQLVTSTVVAPAEVLKQNTQMLAQDKREKGRNFPTLRVARQLIQHPAQLWRGYTALAARDLPFTVLQFPAYERIKAFLIAWRSDHESAHPMLERATISGASAGIAGCAAAWATTPFDVVKTRMMLEAGAGRQVEGGSRAGRLGGACRRSGLQVCKEIFRNEGATGYTSVPMKEPDST